MKKILLVIAVITFANSIAFADWQTGYDGTDANTIGLWHLDGDATSAVDANANGVASAGVTWPTGMFDEGASLGGPASGESIVIAKNGTAGTSYLRLEKTSFTAECWIKPEAPLNTGWTSLITIPYGFNIERKQASTYANLIQFSVYNGGNPANMRSVMSNSEVLRNEWTHIACTLDYDLDNGSTLSIYLNGQLDAQFVTEAGWMNYDGYWFDLGIGNNPGLAGREFDGVIDEVRISNVARTFATVPEPSIILLGAVLLGFFRRK